MPHRTLSFIVMAAILALPSGCGGVRRTPTVPVASPTLADPDAELHALFDAFLDGLMEMGASRDTRWADELVMDTWTGLERLNKDVGHDHQTLLICRTRQRMAGYFRCHVVATEDESWCEGLRGPWEEEVKHCYGVTAIWVMVGQRAIRGGQSCADAVPAKGWLPDFVRAEAGGLCGAMAAGKPEDCPWPDDTEDQTTCLAAALRDGTRVCHELSEDKRPPWWPACCEEFARRFSAFIDPTASPATAPELGAAQGDTAGCERALRRALTDDLGFLFRVPGAPEKSPEQVKAYEDAEAACRLAIPWDPAP